MDPTSFLDDIEQIPSTLAAFARSIDGGTAAWPIDAPPRRVLFLGMGSSFFAASAAASRLRAHGHRRRGRVGLGRVHLATFP
jgi:fructoselysine-6-P-deglycase FrlB-like protein